MRNMFIIKGLVLVGELCLLNLLLYFLSAVCHISANGGGNESTISAMVNLSYLVSFVQFGVVLDKRTTPVEGVLSNVMKTSSLFGVILLIVLYLTNVLTSYKFCIALIVLFFLTSCVWRLVARLILKMVRKHGGTYRKVIILGAGRVADDVYNRIVKNIALGYDFKGFYDDRAKEDCKIDLAEFKGTLADAEEAFNRGEVDEIICALPSGDDRKALPLLKKAERKFVRCYIVPDFKRFIKKGVSLKMVNNIPLINFRDEPLENTMNRIVKRSFDIIVSLVFLLTLFPFIFIGCAIAIKISSPGPIFFRQKRTGKNGKDFYCLKFRTMKVNKDADKQQATKGDSRITKVGAFLRHSNLDEMPQFINVLIGDMSIVGPRPHMVSQTDTYSKLIEDYMVRHLAKPGITGWAQVTGFRGETSELSQMEGRVERDVWYIENWSFWLDIRIIFKTVKNMIAGDEAAF